MVWLTNLLEKPAGKAAGIVFCLAALALGVYVIKSYSTSTALAQDKDRIFIDATTGQSFSHELVLGEKVPVLAPSGNMSGFPAELCYWTKDGTIKSDPTAVLLNSYIGKPGPTFCPDCGRLVVPHNPIAQPGMRPPPTREEWESWHNLGLGPELLHTVASSN